MNVYNYEYFVGACDLWYVNKVKSNVFTLLPSWELRHIVDLKQTSCVFVM